MRLPQVAGRGIHSFQGWCLYKGNTNLWLLELHLWQHCMYTSNGFYIYNFYRLFKLFNTEKSASSSWGRVNLSHLWFSFLHPLHPIQSTCESFGFQLCTLTVLPQFHDWATETVSKFIPFFCCCSPDSRQRDLFFLFFPSLLFKFYIMEHLKSISK